MNKKGPLFIADASRIWLHPYPEWMNMRAAFDDSNLSGQ